MRTPIPAHARMVDLMRPNTRFSANVQRIEDMAAGEDELFCVGDASNWVPSQLKFCMKRHPERRFKWAYDGFGEEGRDVRVWRIK
jgi:hypothetical protein